MPRSLRTSAGTEICPWWVTFELAMRLAILRRACARSQFRYWQVPLSRVASRLHVLLVHFAPRLHL